MPVGRISHICPTHDRDLSECPKSCEKKAWADWGKRAREAFTPCDPTKFVCTCNRCLKGMPVNLVWKCGLCGAIDLKMIRVRCLKCMVVEEDKRPFVHIP